MGIDIFGSFEIRPGSNEEWRRVLSLDELDMPRDYDVFGCLFGVHNTAGFIPIAGDRGVPADASPRTREEFGPGRAQGDTWISAADLRGVDWDEKATTVDERIHRFALNYSNEWVYDGKAMHDPALLEQAVGDTTLQSRPWPEGTEWRAGDHLYRVVRMTRRQAAPVGSPWATLLDTVEQLGRTCGADNARLVVGFES